MAVPGNVTGSRRSARAEPRTPRIIRAAAQSRAGEAIAQDHLCAALRCTPPGVSDHHVAVAKGKARRARPALRGVRRMFWMRSPLRFQISMLPVLFGFERLHHRTEKGSEFRAATLPRDFEAEAESLMARCIQCRKCFTRIDIRFLRCCQSTQKRAKLLNQPENKIALNHRAKTCVKSKTQPGGQASARLPST